MQYGDAKTFDKTIQKYYEISYKDNQKTITKWEM